MRLFLPKPVYFCLLLLSALPGCGESPTVDLYAITDITPKIVEPGDVLVIEGTGFIEGKAEVVLEGTAKPMGLRPSETFHRKLTGAAISENRIEVPITPYLMNTIAKEAIRFSGSASVSFPEIQLEGTVALSGKSPPQQLDFRPTGGGVKIHALKMREAQREMKNLGLILSSDESNEAITVTGVVPDSLADHTGITGNARLISVDGFPVFGLDELAGMDMSRSHQIEFMLPEGASRQMLVNANRPLVDKDEFAAILLTSLVLGIFLAFILPSFRGRSLEKMISIQNPLPFVMGYASAALVTVLFPAVVIQWRLQLSGTVILVAIFLVCNATMLIYGNQTISVRISNAVGSLFSLGAVILMGGFAGNSLGLFDAAYAQSNVLFGFHVWKNPLMMISTVLAISMLWPARFTKDSTPLQFVTAWLQTITGTMLLVFFCMGGWIIPGVNHLSPNTNIWMMLLALLIFFVKTWIVLLAARHLAGATQTERRRHTTISGLYQWRWIPMPILAGTAVYLELAPIPAEAQIAGQIISTGVFCTLFSLFLFSISSQKLSELFSRGFSMGIPSKSNL